MERPTPASACAVRATTNDNVNGPHLSGWKPNRRTQACGPINSNDNGMQAGSRRSQERRRRLPANDKPLTVPVM